MEIPGCDCGFCLIKGAAERFQFGCFLEFTALQEPQAISEHLTCVLVTA